MKTFAGEIAAMLQGAHERRQRGEDKDMSKGEVGKAMEVGVSVWDDDPMVHAMKLVERLGTVLGDLAASGHAPGGEQADAAEHRKTIEKLNAMVTAAEHGSLYWRCTTCNADKHQCPGCGASLNHFQAACDACVIRAHVEAATEELERQLAEVQADFEAARQEIEQWAKTHAITANTLATAYVAREVPWSDVAAGMMTIARDGTPWMVADTEEGGRFIMRYGEDEFTKKPEPGETVRVLVPYVTPEQAQALVVSELGGRA